MQILLDTHILIWFFEDNPEHIKKILMILESADRVYASTINVWEIVLKQSIGKLELNFQVIDLLDKIKESGFDILNIKPEHAIKLADLEDYHNDPFDRMLLAQSLAEPLHLLTADEKIAKYTGNIIMI